MNDVRSLAKSELGSRQWSGGSGRHSWCLGMRNGRSVRINCEWSKCYGSEDKGCVLTNSAGWHRRAISLSQAFVDTAMPDHLHIVCFCLYVTAQSWAVLTYNIKIYLPSGFLQEKFAEPSFITVLLVTKFKVQRIKNTAPSSGKSSLFLSCFKRSRGWRPLSGIAGPFTELLSLRNFF